MSLNIDVQILILVNLRELDSIKHTNIIQHISFKITCIFIKELKNNRFIAFGQLKEGLKRLTALLGQYENKYNSKGLFFHD